MCLRGVGGGERWSTVSIQAYRCTCEQPTGICSIVSISLSRVAHSEESKETSATGNTH